MLRWILKIYYQYKILKYFKKNNIVDEENSISMNSLKNEFSHNKISIGILIDFLKDEQLFIKSDKGNYYLDDLVYNWRYKYKFVYYGEIILLIIFLIFAGYVSHIKTTLFKPY